MIKNRKYSKVDWSRLDGMEKVNMGDCNGNHMDLEVEHERRKMKYKRKIKTLDIVSLVVSVIALIVAYTR